MTCTEKNRSPRVNAAIEKLADDCKSLGISLEIIEHEAVFTVEESAFLHREIEAAHTKNLFLKDHHRRYWLLTMPAEARADLKRIAAIIGAGRLSFAKTDEMVDRLGIEPGAVTRLAILCDLDRRVTVVVDRALLEADRIAVHPLRNTATALLRPDDLLRLLRMWEHEPIVADLSGA